MGSRQIVLVSTAGISVLNAGIFWREAKTKRLFSQCSLAGRYDNPIPSRFLAPIDCLKIPAQEAVCAGYHTSNVYRPLISSASS
jgi:hypothetical protein